VRLNLWVALAFSFGEKARALLALCIPLHLAHRSASHERPRFADLSSGDKFVEVPVRP